MMFRKICRCDVTGYILNNYNLQDIYGIVNRKCHISFKIFSAGRRQAPLEGGAEPPKVGPK